MLERNIEQIGTMYQSVMNEHSLLRVSLNRAERQLAKKEDKIAGLEKTSQEKTKKLEKLTQALLILREQFLSIQQAQGSDLAQRNTTGAANLGGSLKLPTGKRAIIRGGTLK